MAQHWRGAKYSQRNAENTSCFFCRILVPPEIPRVDLIEGYILFRNKHGKAHTKAPTQASDMLGHYCR